MATYGDQFNLIEGLAWSPDSKKIASASQGGTFTFSVAPNDSNSGSQSCPQGTKAFSGGLTNYPSDITVTSSQPAADGSAWDVTASNSSSTTTHLLDVWVVCASATS